MINGHWWACCGCSSSTTHNNGYTYSVRQNACTSTQCTGSQRVERDVHFLVLVQYGNICWKKNQGPRKESWSIGRKMAPRDLGRLVNFFSCACSLVNCLFSPVLNFVTIQLFLFTNKHSKNSFISMFTSRASIALETIARQQVSSSRDSETNAN